MKIFIFVDVLAIICSVSCWLRFRDVKTVYFSELVTGLPKPVFTGYRQTYCERDYCHRSLRACYQSSVDGLLLHGDCGPHSRCTDADAAKQRTVAYLSGRGRGNRCFCRHELITIVTPLSRPGSAKTAASVCLYSVYRKQERPLSKPVPSFKTGYLFSGSRLTSLPQTKYFGP